MKRRTCKKHTIVVYGSSGYSRAIPPMLRQSLGSDVDLEVVAFIDDFTGGRGDELDGAPILSFAQWRELHAAVPCLLAMSSPAARTMLKTRIVDAGGTFVDLYHERHEHIFEQVQIGAGCFIGLHSYVGAQTVIGDHSQIMTLCSIGHDVVIGECCTICPSCTVSGYVVIEDRVFIGAGTTIVNGTARAPLRIGRGAKIWAGSVVTGAVGANAQVAGNPAVPIRELVRHRRARATG